MKISDGESLAFHVNYELREVSCKEAECPRPWPCGAVHHQFTGEATLTLAGPTQLIREAAALVFPDLAKVFNPPPAVEPTGPATCAACGASSADGIPIHEGIHEGRCPECIAGGWYPENPQQAPVHPSHDPLPLDRGASRCRLCRQVLSWRPSGKTSVRGALECPGHPVQDLFEGPFDKSSDDA